MDKYIQIYINEIATQKNFALISYESFLEALNSEKSPQEIFYHIHHFLVHTSNIVKILYPANKPKNPDNLFIQDRAKKLKEKMSISQDDFEIAEIGIRNDFEHYDERIDYWVKNSTNHNYCDMSIIYPGAISGMDVKDMFRNLDPQNNVLSFCGKQYNIGYLKKFLEEKIAN